MLQAGWSRVQVPMTLNIFKFPNPSNRPPVASVVRVRFPALPEKKSIGFGTGSTQPREYN
jgi:hypothetical protein